MFTSSDSTFLMKTQDCKKNAFLINIDQFLFFEISDFIIKLNVFQ